MLEFYKSKERGRGANPPSVLQVAIRRRGGPLGSEPGRRAEQQQQQHLDLVFILMSCECYASDQRLDRCGFTASISIKLPEDRSKQAASRRSWRRFPRRTYAPIDSKKSDITKLQSVISLKMMISFLFPSAELRL